jgi:hypothetical protein
MFGEVAMVARSRSTGQGAVRRRRVGEEHRPVPQSRSPYGARLPRANRSRAHRRRDTRGGQRARGEGVRGCRNARAGNVTARDRQCVRGERRYGHPRAAAGWLSRSSPPRSSGGERASARRARRTSSRSATRAAHTGSGSSRRTAGWRRRHATHDSAYSSRAATPTISRCSPVISI